MAFDPALNSFSRVFIIEGGARPDRKPDFQSCMIAGALSQSFGDITDIECPDPNEYGKFIVVGQFSSGEERVTLPLNGRFAADLRSELARLAKKKCDVDLHVHFGGSGDQPNNFLQFKKSIVVTKARLTSYGTEDLGTLTDDNQNSVGENAETSGEAFYEQLPVTVVERASDLTLNQVIDGTSCDTPNCGDDDSDGCQKFFFVASPSSGSPGTNPDLIYSLDGGSTWQSNEVNSIAPTEEPTGIACVGSYLVVVSNDSASLHYVSRDEVDGIQTPSFTEVSTGFVVGGEPNAISSSGTRGFIVGDGGYVYILDDVASGVTAVDEGAATSSVLNAVYALDESNAVAVGVGGAVIYTDDGETWSAASATPTAQDLNTVLMLSENVWLAGAADGSLYYTVNGGLSWTEKGFPGSGSGEVTALAMSPSGVLWMGHQTTGTAGRLLRSYDGGYSWLVLPESVGSIPANDKINAIATCDFDPNVAIAGGVADDSTSGILLLAKDRG